MGVDAILAALAFRDQAWGREELRAKTIDLRKAYKNLPLSEEATGRCILVCSVSDGWATESLPDPCVALWRQGGGHGFLPDLLRHLEDWGVDLRPALDGLLR